MEFYLFKLDENGEQVKILPYDRAGYMDIAPDDKGKISAVKFCLMLEQMGICPESSSRKRSRANEIHFCYSDPLTAADNAITFNAIVRTVAAQNGLSGQFFTQTIGRLGWQWHAY